MILFKLDWTQLRADLMQAYLDARRHKRNRRYQLDFEADLEANLDRLTDELYNRTYKPLPPDCFIITDPKKREVFAASFRDRVVHHLYYNYVHEMFERTFIADSYSCIKRRGTHYGIRRLVSHIRKESRNYKEDCHVLKMDIRGYFMHINRNRLLELCFDTIDRMAMHKTGKYRSRFWSEVIDISFVKYLTREIVLLDCTADCHLKGCPSDWNGLQPSKSLFHSPEGCGLPIGNLTSQLFSNVYLNMLDQYMKRTLKCRHYGRYVDDFYVVSADRDWLHSLIPQVRAFLKDELGLTLHEGKLRIDSVRQGVEFLGAYLKPWRMLVSRSTLRRMKPKLRALAMSVKAGCLTFEQLRPSLNSFLGVLGHYRSYRLRKAMLNSLPYCNFTKLGSFTLSYDRFVNAIGCSSSSNPAIMSIIVKPMLCH